MKLGRSYVESLLEKENGLYTWVEVAGKRYYLRDVGPASVLDGELFRHGEDEARAAFYSSIGVEKIPHALSVTDVLPLEPGKILCVGLNYHDHAEEVGAELPTYPTIFTKYANSLVGPDDPIAMPPESTKIDYEAELCVVMGRRVRRANEEEALAAIAGYTLFNDISVRDWQGRTSEWFQGKNWDYSTPLGPHIVARNEVDPVAGLQIECLVDGEVMQSGTTANMIFTPAQIVSYLSTFMTLEPGDVIACGTPAGVGMSKKPRRFWLKAGHDVTVRIEGIGELTNTCRPEGETVDHFAGKSWWGPVSE
ncbi:fumarylacetoacetate hydrolase family protein [Kocuria sp. HSID16901]|uniref:fumarylacetoacetate hydrolase family protein n=1 Tax=Kocuria sp. HSID16901 TaxID=2419505 RepID=UPI00069D5541|nr:fumarylacetoacetate hydrolase family protein [Kocuria sp. HSID16901]RUQ22679.1 FAA hydrolase family protein [Kocuria sp. HSID16901]